MFYLLILLLIGGTVLGVTALVALISNLRDKNRKALVRTNTALNKAEAALRSIANGAGSPVLEAEIALDEINAHRAKELN